MSPRNPWYRGSNDAWYVEIDGKQEFLAKGKANKAIIAVLARNWTCSVSRISQALA